MKSRQYSPGRIVGRQPFLLSGVALLVILFGTRFATGGLRVALPARVQDLLTLALSIVVESLPFVLLGIFLSIIVQVWLPERLIVRFLPRRAGLRRICISFLGVFLPVCECGNVPLARGLVAQGFTVAESLTFLLAAPILNPVTIITTHQAFPSDPQILLARVLGGFLIANVVGWLFSKHRQPQRLLTPEFVVLCKVREDHHHAKFDRSAEIFIQEVNAILPALLGGALLAGLVQVVVPRSDLLAIGANPLLSIGVMMLLAFVVSICSNVDAFFALAFSNSFSVGSIVSFLTFGPVIDIKMLNLMRTTYRINVLLVIMVVAALLSVIMGLVVNYAL